MQLPRNPLINPILHCMRCPSALSLNTIVACSACFKITLNIATTPQGVIGPLSFPRLYDVVTGGHTEAGTPARDTALDAPPRRRRDICKGLRGLALPCERILAL